MVRSLGRKWQIPVSDGLKGSQGDLKIQTPNCYEIEWARCKMRYPSNTLWHAFYYTTYIQQEKKPTDFWVNKTSWDECFGLNFGWQVILLSIGIPGKDSQPVVTPIHRRQVSEAKCVQMPRWLRVLKLGENFIEFIKVPTIINIMYLYRYASFVFAYCQSAFFRP